MQGGDRNDELKAFLEFCDMNLESSSNLQVDLYSPDHVLAQAQANPSQNEVSLENRNTIPNPNPNPNPNQVQDQELFSPSQNMHLNPNLNNFAEPGLRPYYQMNPEVCVCASPLPSNGNQYMVRAPFQPSTSSHKRGNAFLSIQSVPTGISINSPSYFGIGNSASESMQGNIGGFVRNTRMRVEPGQARTGTVKVSPSTAHYNMGFPRPNPNPKPNPVQQMAGGDFVRTNMMQILQAPAPAPAPVATTTRVRVRVTPQSQAPLSSSSSHRQLTQNEAVLVQRAHYHAQLMRALVSSGASQMRSEDVSLRQPVPPIPTGNSGPLVLQERPQFRRFLPPIRTRLTRGTSTSTVPIQVAHHLVMQRAQAMNLARAFHSGADVRQIEQRVASRSRQMVTEWRQADRHRDMRLDIDNMSHEELLALEDRIGYVSTGISEEMVNERMKQKLFSHLLEKGAEPCSICQEEYVEKDQVGTLDCGHIFHKACITKWLGHKNICPICKLCGIFPKK